MKTYVNSVIIEAHRGDSSNAPENTMAAFQRALELNVPSIELDVHPAVDGTLMVIHDANVDRTTNGTGAVCDKSVKELRTLDAGTKFAPEFAGERIPVLTDVLKLLTQSNIQLNIEVKAASPGRNVPLTLVNLLRRFGKQRHYVVSSFNLQSLLEVRKIAPEITLALIGNGPETLPQARFNCLPWIHCNFNTVDEQLIARAHAGNIRVNIWTMDDPVRLAYWRGINLDKICTNCPAKMLVAAVQN